MRTWGLRVTTHTGSTPLPTADRGTAHHLARAPRCIALEDKHGPSWPAMVSCRLSGRGTAQLWCASCGTVVVSFAFVLNAAVWLVRWVVLLSAARDSHAHYTYMCAPVHECKYRTHSNVQACASCRQLTTPARLYERCCVTDTPAATRVVAVLVQLIESGDATTTL